MPSCFLSPFFVVQTFMVLVKFRHRRPPRTHSHLVRYLEKIGSTKEKKKTVGRHFLRHLHIGSEKIRSLENIRQSPGEASHARFKTQAVGRITKGRRSLLCLMYYLKKYTKMLICSNFLETRIMFSWSSSQTWISQSIKTKSTACHWRCAFLLSDFWRQWIILIPPPDQSLEAKQSPPRLKQHCKQLFSCCFTASGRHFLRSG